VVVVDLERPKGGPLVTLADLGWRVHDEVGLVDVDAAGLEELAAFGECRPVVDLLR
jgi:hypothetical protein